MYCLRIVAAGVHFRIFAQEKDPRTIRGWRIALDNATRPAKLPWERQSVVHQQRNAPQKSKSHRCVRHAPLQKTDHA